MNNIQTRLIKQKFLKALTQSKNIRQAAKYADVSRSTIYSWMGEDQQFKAWCQQAVDSPSMKRRQGEPIPREQLQAVKDTVLHAFSDTANVLESAQLVGISRSAVYLWLRNDAQFKAQFDHIRMRHDAMRA